MNLSPFVTRNLPVFFILNFKVEYFEKNNIVPSLRYPVTKWSLLVVDVRREIKLSNFWTVLLQRGKFKLVHQWIPGHVRAYNRSQNGDVNIHGTWRFNTYDFGLLIADMTNFGPAGIRHKRPELLSTLTRQMLDIGNAIAIILNS